jgi:hypothetical protein
LKGRKNKMESNTTLNEVWEWMKKVAREKELNYIEKDGKEIIIDKNNKTFFLKCKAKYFQEPRIMNI